MEGKSTAAVLLTPLAAPPTSAGGGGLSRNWKIVLITTAVGLTAVGVFSTFFRRPTRKRNSKQLNNVKREDAVDGYVRPFRGDSSRNTSNTSTIVPNFSPRPGQSLDRTGGRSSVSSIHTQSTLVSNSYIEPGTPLTATQLGILGMEKLEKSISFWDESLYLLRQELESNLDEEDAEQCRTTISQLEEILKAACHLKNIAQELYLDEGSVLYAESERASISYGRGRLRSVSSVESFMSAEDFLSDDEEIRHSLENAGIIPGETCEDGVFPLYEAAFRLVEAGAVPYRSLKTEMVGCKNGDQEYLAKLHCLRGAFSRLISDVDKRHWISLKGKDVFSKILLKADKDPTDFEESYEAIINWSQEGGNWGLIENELKDRGVRALTFYDIVLDYIFLDAFEDLESPPASVLAVTQNRWLSNSFKETALGTAVWSVLKTKRKWLRYSDGFMAHFYTLSEQIMPTFAWGFLGPSTDIQELCFFFKDKFLEFLNAVFSFEEVRYTTLDDLAEDVMKQLKIMHSEIIKRIAEMPSLY